MIEACVARCEYTPYTYIYGISYHMYHIKRMHISMDWFIMPSLERVIKLENDLRSRFGGLLRARRVSLMAFESSAICIRHLPRTGTYKM